jgi:hypothetical protein
MTKFEWRKLFPITWYRWNRGHDFNIVTFYLDTLVWTIPLSIFLAKCFLSFVFQVGN